MDRFLSKINANVRQLIVSALLMRAMLHVQNSCEGFLIRIAHVGFSAGSMSKGPGATIAEFRPRGPVVGRSAAGDGTTATTAAVPPNGGGPTCTCRNCMGQFRRNSNTDDACSYHPGLFSGRLNRINDVDTSGLEFFWSCCGEYDSNHPGCVRGRHFSYDDPPDGGEGGWRSPLTGTLRSN